MDRAELIDANSSLRDTIDAITDALELDFDDPASMDMDALEDENEQLEDILAKVRALADGVLDDSETD